MQTAASATIPCLRAWKSPYQQVAKMKKAIMFVLIASICRIASAQQSPVVGLWEQVVAGDRGDGSPVNTQRVDVVFVDRKINEDTRFSGLFAADISPQVLCCVDVKRDDLISLSALLKKYPWDPDTADHLKKITGWKYIYEAKLVKPNEQNAKMRSLVKSLTVPPTLSPYSAPVISGEIATAQMGKEFKVGNADVAYSVRMSNDKNSISYKFVINGKPVTLTEDMFPAE
ncbi:hypothetical protein [Trinickia dabaoshanensis]|nr:hypothetical protein [Trinickia dabaoshanensis]